MLDTLLAEGKTKLVYEHDADTVRIVQKDDITAGDGARRDVMPGKGDVTAHTTRRVFEYLGHCGVKTHFLRYAPPNEVYALRCHMVPLEVVARRIPTGSYTKRHPDAKGPFDPPVIEFFFKDDAGHDPLISTDEIMRRELLDWNGLEAVTGVTLKVFGLLEAAWRRQNVTLVDLKVEFGWYKDELLLADDFENGSWRLWENGDPARILDKQVYRNLKEVTPEGLRKVFDLYQRVANMTDDFLKKET
jgi:phosphoribosylaminoimidazole-succinocarboxamide synthase